ncbi:hypothetical protein [Pseudomonas helleri]|uniref:hypothetical protein n=1 Tax=Pseudomonas helleri TaxID=1608996 RepID=UPI0030D84E31
MQIILSPVRTDEPEPKFVRQGDVIFINGQPFDFRHVEEGDILPASAITSDDFHGDVTRVEGEIQLVLRFPYPANFSEEQAFPTPIQVDFDGPIGLPQPLPEPPAPEPLPPVTAEEATNEQH